MPWICHHLLGFCELWFAKFNSDPAASSAASISINEPISEEGLFALYNLLTVKPSDTDGIDYGVFNGASTGNSHNAQLVGDVSSTFTLGLGVPYLKGVANISNTTPSSVSSMGSYIKLPEKKEFQDLLYTREGATFESWVHIPAFSSYDLGADASGLYRLLLANENTGLESNTSAQSDILNLYIILFSSNDIVIFGDNWLNALKHKSASISNLFPYLCL